MEFHTSSLYSQGLQSCSSKEATAQGLLTAHHWKPHGSHGPSTTALLNIIKTFPVTPGLVSCSVVQEGAGPEDTKKGRPQVRGGPWKQKESAHNFFLAFIGWRVIRNRGIWPHRIGLIPDHSLTPTSTWGEGIAQPRLLLEAAAVVLPLWDQCTGTCFYPIGVIINIPTPCDCTGWGQLG